MSKNKLPKCRLCETLDDHGTMWKVMWVLVVIVLLGMIVIGARYAMKEYKEPDWKDDMIEVLRAYEVSWDSEEQEDWEEKQTYPLDYTIPYAAYENGRFKPGNKVMKVGSEILYTEDFNQELFINHYNEFVDEQPVQDELLTQVAQMLIQESVVLQEAGEEELIKLTDEVYDSSYKDQVKRAELITSAEQELEETGESHTELEKIVIWFYNTEVPEIGVTAAREIAEEKMQDLHARVREGTLTFKKAGELIKSDPVLRDIDFGIDGNAYNVYSFNGPAKDWFNDPELADKIEELSVGEVSDILVGRDKGEDNNGDWYDANFTVVRVNSRREGFDSYEIWLSETVSVYPIVVNNFVD